MLTDSTMFVVLVKTLSMQNSDVVLPDSLLKNRTVNCLTFEENTRQPYTNKLCFVRDVAFQLPGNHKLKEETSQLFTLLISTVEGCKPNQFKSVQMNVLPNAKNFQRLNIRLHKVDLSYRKVIGGVDRRE